MKRPPLPAAVPRPVKRASGRTPAARTPANIRLAGVRLTGRERTRIRRKLAQRLGKFATSIERVTVRIRDVNGPRGGVDTACRVKVVLSALPSVIVEERHHRLTTAVDAALLATERAVRRAIARRRLKPLRDLVRRPRPAGRPRSASTGR